MSYPTWETFITKWYHKRYSIQGWSNPQDTPLYNDNEKRESTIDFIPEPWWGNDGSTELHSVIINYNPGKAGPKQARTKVPYKGSYAADIVIPPYLSDTADWHERKRALPILDALHDLGFIPSGYNLQNHLSIELIPWHTSGINGTGYWAYVKNNIKRIYEDVICFAASESKKISNSKLKGVVLLRMSEKSFKRIKAYLTKKGITVTLKNPAKSEGKAKYVEYSITSLPDIRFILIWGAGIRNNLPNHADLKTIIASI